MARRSEGRLPPFDLEAEAATLGAALLSATAVETLLTGTTVADFYKPAHQHIAAAIFRLAELGRVADTITVADQLRTNGLLEDSGGIGYLNELVTVIPSIARSAHYARIVTDNAHRRRLIHELQRISDTAYDAGDPASLYAAITTLGDRHAGATLSVSTWEFSDSNAMMDSELVAETPTILHRSDGTALLYPGKMHAIVAEPSSGKSWVAIVACAQLIAAGNTVVYMDYEDNPQGVFKRLVSVGAAATEIRNLFHYSRPYAGFGIPEQKQLAAMLETLRPALVVIDGVGEALSRQGLSEDKADDVVKWTDLLPRAITRSGASVLMLDHVAKDPEHRGRWARGSSAKLAVIDGASFQLKVRIPFSKKRAGRIDLVIAKDRPGSVGAIGEVVSAIEVIPAGDGNRVTFHLTSAEQVEIHTAWKPTHLMEQIWNALDRSSVALTTSTLLLLAPSAKPAHARTAIAELIAGGFVTEIPAGRRKILRTVKPYPPGSAGSSSTKYTNRTEPPLFDYDEEEPSPTDEELADIIAQDPDYFDRLYRDQSSGYFADET